ncbi:hypothetical protein [Erythrobacter sp. JK5]|uniref:hypothetical protein n=1 Tax=Erythrobacter sp. JK5 TaxID=2829500 RepID=UPI001BA68B2C|nr:hypothetical protein [Erythrobacter sp. JK5]QUL39227.1 hypothetical protein KDC96_07915 [Erythrobacter sp. JK5]
MTDSKPSNWPIVVMIAWYVVLLAGSAGIFLIGLMFGSEAYRGRPMPIIEWLLIGGPLVLNAALLATTIWLWNTGRRTASIALTGASLIVVVGLVALGGLLVL